MKKVKKIVAKMLLCLLFVTVFVGCNSSETASELAQNKQQQMEETQEMQQQQISQIQNEEEQTIDETLETLRIIGNKVNVRSEPSVKAKVIAQLNINETFGIKGRTDKMETIATQNDYWYKIEKKGQDGWVFGALTSKTLNEKENNDEGETTLEILGDKVNVRSEPSIKGKVLFQLRINEVVEVKKQSDDYETVGEETDYWYQIEKDGKRGWVFGSLTSRMLIYEGCSG